MDGLEKLDYWTQVSLDAYWRELVKRAQEVNNTAIASDSESETGSTD
tara:strand:+ start:567 stop:707 length:141 start_codon:yes stop_codon:yes gene_type:complete